MPDGIKNILKYLQGHNPNYITPASIARKIGNLNTDYSLLLSNITRTLTDSLNNRLDDAI